MKYELELNSEIGSVNRIKQFFEHYHEILIILNQDSEKGIEGGAMVHYKVKIEIEEKWI